jgi:4-amino-4-deoxy-L-arabinose transferase-like glycosyltransferase
VTSEQAERRSEQRAVTLIIVAFIILGAVYSVVTPIFEASDELWHYPVVHHMAHGNGLPVQDPMAAQLWRQEGSQPPLFYALGALLTAWVDTSDLPEVRRSNPHADIGVLTAAGNVNMTVHTALEDFPYRGTTLAVHLVRWMSVLMGAVTVALTYIIARMVFAEIRGAAVLATALVAFNPMFLFISASVNNDNLVVMLCTLALLMILRLDEGRLTLWRFVSLGLVIGLAVLTKANALGLIPLAGLGLLLVTWQDQLPTGERHWWRFLRGSVTIIGVILVVAGWWFVRNWQLYGDPLGLNMLVEITGPRHPQPTLWQLAGEWQGFVWSFWGLFGGLNVALEPWTYTLFNIVAILAVLGLLVFAWRCWRKTCQVNGWRMLVLVAWPIIVFVSLIRWTLMTPASQGRLMFSALASIGALMAVGLVQWMPVKYRRVGVGLSALVLVVLSAITPFRVIGPAYALPQPLSATEIGNIPNRLDVIFGEGMRLVGYRVDEGSILPGEKLPVTLYWEALAPSERDYSVFVHLLAEHDLVMAQRDTYPGRGMWPTTEWNPGEIFADTVVLEVPQTAYTPNRGQIEVGIYDFDTGERLTAVGDDGQSLGDNVRFQEIAVNSLPNGAVPNPVHLNFEGKLALVGYSLDFRAAAPGEKLGLTLYWQALQPMTENYTVFTHILGENESIWAQKDGQPQRGTAATSSWQQGMLIEDQYDLLLRTDTPPGVYEVEVGLYLPESGKRLGVLGERGRLDADHVVLTHVRVVP